MPPRAARRKNAVVPAQAIPPVAAQIVPPLAGNSRLERIPAEILQSIFDLLHIFDESAQPDLIKVNSLSKCLLAYSTAALYRNIKIYSSFDLGLLASTVLRDSANQSLGELISTLVLDGSDEEEEVAGPYAKILERLIEALMCSLNRLKFLEVIDWDLAGKIVLSPIYGKQGGRALEKIKMEDSFGDIIGPVSVSINHLKNLPELTTVEYYHSSPVIEDSIDFSEIGSIGFAKVTTLYCSNYFPSIHTKNIASLFPAVAKLTLVHLDLDAAPNYGPLLTALKPETLQALKLSAAVDSHYEAEAGLHPIHQEILRFNNLSSLELLDRRVLDIDLIDSLPSLHSLNDLYIHSSCKISFDLIYRLLSGFKNRKFIKEFQLDVLLEMVEGEIGVTYEDGAKPVLENDILVPGFGWKKPIWSDIFSEEGKKLMELAKEARVKLGKSIPDAIEVEEAFVEELAWLSDVMQFMRNGKQFKDQV